ncbi:unnamed protein product [Blepharisma stoltei]|uniref:EF-hand domain-containing protein n=1 Tax=Blepharisma stoltei TaxID=1481888 RepID=A0AAU9ILF4_9CILI|nr:unnamed protein product [Blepharisma stoltei]
MARHLQLSQEELERVTKLMSEFYDHRDDSKLHDLFRLFDLNGNGTIEATELQAVMSQVSGERIPEEEIRDMIREADANKNGVIEFNEFIEVMRRHRD